jgi:hypothetical protein
LSKVLVKSSITFRQHESLHGASDRYFLFKLIKAYPEVV